MNMIDLLVAISKGEEVPKKIRFMGCRYTWNDDFYRYVNEDDKVELHNLTSDINIFACTNDEVEILDEEPKPIIKEIIEALRYACGEIKKCFENGWNKSLENKPLIEEEKKIEKIDINDIYGIDINDLKYIIIEKLNEIMDYINNKEE